jgi:hypothetical protein
MGERLRLAIAPESRHDGQSAFEMWTLAAGHGAGRTSLSPIKN